LDVEKTNKDKNNMYEETPVRAFYYEEEKAFHNGKESLTLDPMVCDIS